MKPITNGAYQQIDEAIERFLVVYGPSTFWAIENGIEHRVHRSTLSSRLQILKGRGRVSPLPHRKWELSAEWKLIP